MILSECFSAARKDTKHCWLNFGPGTAWSLWHSRQAHPISHLIFVLDILSGLLWREPYSALLPSVVPPSTGWTWPKMRWLDTWRVPRAKCPATWQSCRPCTNESCQACAMCVSMCPTRESPHCRQGMATSLKNRWASTDSNSTNQTVSLQEGCLSWNLSSQDLKKK